MKHPHYYKVKAAELEFLAARAALVAEVHAEMQRQFEVECHRRIQPLLERRRQVFVEAGLDPAKNYDLSDVTESITESPTATPAAAAIPGARLSPRRRRR